MRPDPSSRLWRAADWCLAAALLLLLAWPLAASAEEAPPAAAVEEAPVEPPPGSDLTVRSQEALSALDDLKARVAELGDVEAEAEQVAGLREKAEALLPEDLALEELAENPAILDGVLVRSRALSNQAGGVIDQLTRGAEAVESMLQEVRSLIADWERIREESTDVPDALRTRIDDILSRARELEETLKSKLNQIIELQNTTMEVRQGVTPLVEQINGFDRERQTRLFQRNVEPIWAITTQHITESSERSGRRLAGNLREDFLSWMETSEAAIGGHLLLLPLLLFLLFRLKAAAQHPSAALSRPVPTGILIWMLIGVVIYASSPQAVRLVFVILAMIVAAIVLVNFLPKHMRLGVVGFVVVALLHEFIQSMPIADHAPRVMYLLIASFLAVLCWFARKEGTMDAIMQWGAPRALIAGSVNVALLLLLIGILLNVVGYVQLSKLLTMGVIDSIAVFLVLYAGFSSVSEIIQVVLGLPALDGVRSISANRYRLQRVLRRPLVWLSLLLWLWATLRAFSIDGLVIGSIQSVFRADVAIGEVTLSLRGVVVFVFAVWLAVWASRIVRAVLNQDVLPRMDLPRGIPNTISMTAHYSIILIGLLLGVGFMGIDLSSLAFIVGALGVGIGFGLQNLVNNFVSGLILIFEAPIQVGDTVEVGNLMGRVVQIGIRTSRVRTYSGSEVIVPNGDLVSNQVINWTLSDRRRRLELTVGVAYGSDTDRVTEILRAVLEADDDVLKDPEPLIIFTEFGDSSLNFRIYAWIPDFDIGFSMTHRLNTAINNALEEAGITIPFPQRDLHVKTLPPDAPNPA